MREPRSNARAKLHVTIVSANPETLDGLQTYLRQAGVRAHATRRLGGHEETDGSQTAVVFFPDEFRREEVIVEIARLQRARPDLLSIIVTREPRQFEGIESDERALAPVLIPKPAWGWTILDVIRAHTDGA